MIQFYNKYKKLLISLIALIFVGIIVSKESVLLTEEFLLIIAFLTFLYLTFNTFAKLFNDELEARGKNIAFTIQEFLFYKQKVVVALREFYKKINKINFILNQVEGNMLKAFKKVYSIMDLNKDIENYLIEQQLRTIFYEQYKFSKDVYLHSIKDFSNSSTTMLLNELNEFTNDKIIKISK